VVDGQQNIDLRNFNVAHDSFGGEVQERWVLVVFLQLTFKRIGHGNRVSQLPVVFCCPLQFLFCCLVIQTAHRIGIVRNDLGLVEIIEPLTHSGISQQGTSSEKDAPCQD